MARGHILNRGKRTKSKKPNWCFIAELGTDDRGKRKRLWRSGYATREQAEDALIAFMANQKETKPITPKPKNISWNRRSVSDYLQHWLKNCNVRGTTADYYEYLIKNHIIPGIGDILLANLHQQHIADLYKTKTTYALKTRQGLHTTLRTALQSAVENDIISKNPCLKKLRPVTTVLPEQNMSYSIDEIDKIPYQFEAERTVDAMTDEELGLFLKEVCDTRFYVAHLLAVRRGLRRGEILGLLWRDIDFTRKTLTIRRSLVMCKGKPVFHPPKTKRSVRTITLSDELIKALRKHYQQQKEQQMKRRLTWKDYNLVFTTVDGRPFCPNRFRERHFKKYVKKINLSHFTFHDLRHTAATMMLKDGVNIKIVSEVLGHSNEAFTLKVYGHILPGMQRDALIEFDAKK